MNLSDLKHIYFLGIGGIGMSALARYLNSVDRTISGYDRESTQLTKKLEAEGMNIHYKSDVDQIPEKIDLVVYTPAIAADNAEMVEIKHRNLPLLKRSETLKLALNDTNVLAVAGTHGKTTTSAILAHLMNSQGRSVTAFVGGVMNNYQANFIKGKEDYVIIEADEFDRSFLRLFPSMAVIQAMDADHLDIYNDIEQLHLAFRQFTNQIDRNGCLWVYGEVARKFMSADWQTELIERSVKVRTFGFDDEDDVQAKIGSQANGKTEFTLNLGSKVVACEFFLPGRHNIQNAVAASSMAFQLGLSPTQIVAGLKSFEGIERRFEWIHRSKGLIIIDDYAHHPTEISAAINTVRDHFDNRKLTVVFQPHLFTRTRDFQIEFAKVLDQADEVILLDIYPAREEPITGVTSKMLLNLMKNENKRLTKKEKLTSTLDKSAIDVLLILGAGDIYKLIPEIKSHLT